MSESYESTVKSLIFSTRHLFYNIKNVRGKIKENL